MNCNPITSENWKRTICRRYSELKQHTEGTEKKVTKCDVCLCKIRQNEHHKVGSNGGLHGDFIEDSETKWNPIGRRPAI